MDTMMKQTSVDSLNRYEYTRGMGAYRPHFEGVNDSYYPLSKCAVLGILVGFIFWVLATGTEIYVIIWVSISLFLFAIALILFFIGGKDRRRLQKEMIAQNTKKQQTMMNKGNRKNDASMMNNSTSVRLDKMRLQD